MTFQFDNHYARLPAALHTRIAPTPVREPSLVVVNEPLARDLGLDITWLVSAAGVATLAGNRVPAGAEPLAQAYAGHQFGHFTMLGDGRAILLGEIRNRDGALRDIQLKGAGPTPYSRGGDGRASLGPVLRELIVSEAMHGLGIPTTRALAAVLTGEPVFRQTPERGAILTRVASSHVRVGTFELFAANKDLDSLRALVDFSIRRHYPAAADEERPALALFRAVMKRQASLIARWLGVGFIHGVMNTDNTTISGETIDYGPCAFMDEYDPATVFSSIDRQGRYAYGAQAAIIGWNMARLAQALLPVIDDDVDTAVELAQGVADDFAAVMQESWLDVFRSKIGVLRPEPGDGEIITGLLRAMHEGRADFTNTFRALCDAADEPAGDEAVRAHFADPRLFDEWATTWRQRLTEESDDLRRERMRQANPAYIPRNHRVEAALTAAIESDDLGPTHELLEVIRRPYDAQPGREQYCELPAPEERVCETFCGT